MKNTRLIRLRRKRGMSQQQVADKAYISRSAYSAYENKKRTPNVNTAKKILRVLGAEDKSVSDFF